MLNVLKEEGVNMTSSSINVFLFADLTFSVHQDLQDETQHQQISP